MGNLIDADSFMELVGPIARSHGRLLRLLVEKGVFTDDERETLVREFESDIKRSRTSHTVEE